MVVLFSVYGATCIAKTIRRSDVDTVISISTLKMHISRDLNVNNFKVVMMPSIME